MLSSRFRGKSLVALRGVPLLVRVLECIQRLPFVDEVVVATSLAAADEPIAALAASRGVGVVRGDEMDVLSRFAQAAEDLAEKDTVVRFTADNPFYDLRRSAAAFHAHAEGHQDYTYVDGLSHSVPEFIRVGALRRADSFPLSAHDREHVTPFLRRDDEVRALALPAVFEGLRPDLDGHLTVDQPSDLRRLEAMLDEVELDDEPIELDRCYAWLDAQARADYDARPRSSETSVQETAMLLGEHRVGEVGGMAANRTGWILVAGYGSIGRRHFRNLKTLGFSDVRLLRSGRPPASGFGSPEGVVVYQEVERALADRPAVVIVATPSALHAPLVREAIDAGACVLLEKPVCADAAQAELLLDHVEAVGGVCSMAYCFRYHPLYRLAHGIVANGGLGRVFYLRTWQASYLPDWHPWEDFRQGYAGSRELGGGVIRTLDHDLDFLHWTLGEPTSGVARGGALSGLGLEVEDTADLLFTFPDRVQAHAHLSFARRDYARGVEIVGEEASLVLDWNRGCLEQRDGAGAVVVSGLPSQYDLNDMYLNMLRHAMSGFLATRPRAAVPLRDGVAALRMGTMALQAMNP